jgi:hypothetical protein
MAISTRDLSGLPDIQGLKRVMQSMAMLDAIIAPDWESRYYSFNAHWLEDAQMGSMRNGEGDDLYVHYSTAGCLLKGFDHESRMSPWKSKPPKVWPGVLDSVPKDFSAALNEPAFSMESTTFCIWRFPSDTEWKRGFIEFPSEEDADGSLALLSPLSGNQADYIIFAESYYEITLNAAAVKHIFDHKPLSNDIIRTLNTEVTLNELESDRAEIGYPSR